MQIPKHVAIIMDGNGRWARERGYPRWEGHKAGVNTLKQITKKAGEMGIKFLTVYAFSTENWKRPGSEVSFLMKLFQQTIAKQAKELMENGVKVKVIGRRDKLSANLLQSIDYLEELTSRNQRIQLNIALNYGGRAEILDAAQQYFKNYLQGKSLGEITEADFAACLYCPEASEVELLIRTGGEKRLSNFLLWELAYAELYFCDRYWPDFSPQDFEAAIREFQNRDRRFGGLSEVKG